MINNRKVGFETFFLGPLIGFLLILGLNLLTFEEIIKGLLGQNNFSPFGILILFLSMVFISIFLDTTGFFKFCARLALKVAGKSGTRLFLMFYAIISILTVFTSNDIIILTFTPFIYYYAKEAQVDPKPYLIAEFFAANTWSMALYIGNPTNILLASAFSVNFTEYISFMILPTIIAGTINLLFLYFIFRKKINKPLVYDSQLNSLKSIDDKSGAILGLTLLGLCIILLAIAPYYSIQLWVISFYCAILLIIIILIRDIYRLVYSWNKSDLKKSSIKTTIMHMPWLIIPFIISLFIIVESIKLSGLTTEIGNFFRDLSFNSQTVYVYLFGYISAFSANFLNNIPMSVAFVPIIGEASLNGIIPAVFATIIGSNLGANITPLGALAGIMWKGILKSKDYHIKFMNFLKYGLIVTPISLFACLGILSLQFIIF